MIRSAVSWKRSSDLSLFLVRKNAVWRRLGECLTNNESMLLDMALAFFKRITSVCSNW